MKKRVFPVSGEFHGGQSWMSCSGSFVDDFSVTTNFQGPPHSAISAAKQALCSASHYPSQTCTDARFAMSEYIKWPAPQILLGNGASEFIDLVIRLVPEGPFRLGPSVAQYSEYERAARLMKREIITWESDQIASLCVIINPNSPTGDFLDTDGLRACIAAHPEEVFVFDESFLPFKGSDWRDHSALDLVAEFPSRAVVITSWTKIWSCPGLRIGSVAGSCEWIDKIAKYQVPWSCNSMAQEFVREAVKEKTYMEVTWKTIPDWKKRMVNLLNDAGLTVLPSDDWVPFMFVKCIDETEANYLHEESLKTGVPIRWCKSHGHPDHIRLGVRSPEAQDVLLTTCVRPVLSRRKRRTQETILDRRNIYI